MFLAREGTIERQPVAAQPLGDEPVLAPPRPEGGAQLEQLK
ncbi:hypothetical protein [Phyllobacterium sp. K27]